MQDARCKGDSLIRLISQPRQFDPLWPFLNGPDTILPVIVGHEVAWRRSVFLHLKVKLMQV